MNKILVVVVSLLIAVFFVAATPAVFADEGLEVLGMEISTSSTEVKVTVTSGSAPSWELCYYGRLVLEINGKEIAPPTERERVRALREQVQTPVLVAMIAEKRVGMQSFADPATDEVILRFIVEGTPGSILVVLAAGGELC
jgi:hypothetical protein